ncbi:MAG: D-alanyl-lipoteichoic acid biosynthesis protein DltD [Oenococcus sicerae]|uniref:D-alanyl-lipoteichoic acid biosynthesis protein DltD n=1 Tax=Oenococcus sicerae TaxID=2203724 RepID=UPI0010B18299|nr:hypothetical protein OAL24_00205 [Oenococcus sicerae]
MKGKLWQIFGPVIIAAATLLFLLFAPFNYSHFSAKDEERAAVALNSVAFKNQQLKKQALLDPKTRYIPFFGSSEWARMDPFHPSVLAVKYQRNYRPFLMGRRGTQSLTQYFAMQSILPELKNKEAVFVISPQWFDKCGAQPDEFNYYFSNLQGTEWLDSAKDTEIDRYAARRFLQLQTPGKKNDLAKMYLRIAAGEPLTGWQRWQINRQKQLLEHEDQLFSRLQINDNFDRRILPASKQLPKNFNYKELDRLADTIAAKVTNNNAFGILNRFYDKRIKPVGLHHLKGVQRHISYARSPEYGDLQLVLNQFAKEHVNVMFVIPPVNHKWAKYTGLNESNYQEAVRKIKFQLHAQSFDHIADFSKDGSRPYFMQDTIHLGWRGWLAFDKKVNPFLSHPTKAAKYRINNRFLSHEWQQLKPTERNLKQFN